MISVSTFGWIFFIGLSLLIYGRYFRDYTTGILGGLWIFLFGFYVMVTGLTGLASWMSATVGGILFGLGAYVWINGSLEALNLK